MIITYNVLASIMYYNIRMYKCGILEVIRAESVVTEYRSLRQREIALNRVQCRVKGGVNTTVDGVERRDTNMI